MAKSTPKAAIGYKYGRLVEQSGGMVDAVVHPALLKDSEARLLKNVSIREKGTVKTTEGRKARFDTPFDASNPCNGLTAFYPDTTTSRLVMGAGSKLYSDTPHLITKWTDQADFDEAGSVKTNVDTSTTPGEIKVKTNAVEPTFTRASAAYLEDGTQVPAGQPRFEPGKFGKGILIEEGTTNRIIDPSLFTVYTDAIATRTIQSGGEFDGWYKVEVTQAGGSGVISYLATNVISMNEQVSFGVDFYSPSGNIKVMVSGSIDAGDMDFLRNYRYGKTWLNDTGADRTMTVYFQNKNLTPGAINETFYYRFYQVEDKPFPTSFVDGTKAAEDLTIPRSSVLPSLNAFIIAFRAYPNLTKIGLAQIAGTNFARTGFLEIGNYHAVNESNICVWKDNTDGANAIKVSVVNNQVFTQSSKITLTQAEWAEAPMIVLRYDGSKMYLDTFTSEGHQQVSVEASITHPVADLIRIGRAGNEYINGIIDELRIDKVFRTDEEIAGWYSLGAPLMPDEHTTALFPFDGNLYNGGGVWVSATKDVSAAVDTASGKLAYTATIPGTSSIALETRTSEDGTTWSAWTGILQDGTIQSTHQRYIQVRARLRLNGADNPSIQDITLSYDGTPTATELASGFTAGGQFYFATMLNTLIATNMLDAPKKWNGTDAIADLGGTPPHAQYVATHRNFVFMARTLANPNRLYFSEVLNFNSWPVLNFIDVSPNDGDWITGLMPYDDYLIIAKNRSIWLLMGTGTSDFEVRRIHDGVGCVAPRSLAKMAQSFVFASSEGYYMSDLSQEVLLSERLKETWRGLNQRRLNQIAAIYYDHKLRIDVPNGSSTINNLRIVYDTIQKALSLEEFSDHASCYAKFTEAGHEILLYGHSTEGQISRADYGTTDDGQPLAMTWGTKYFNFGSSAIEKKLRYLYLVVIPAASANTLTVYLVVNGVRNETPLTIDIPGDVNGVARTIKLDPRRVDVRKVKSIGYDIVQSSTNGGVKIHELLQEYMIRKIRETA